MSNFIFFKLKPSDEDQMKTYEPHISWDYPYFRDLVPPEVADTWDAGLETPDEMLIDFGLTVDVNFRLNQLWWAEYSDKRIEFRDLRKWKMKLKGVVIRNQEAYARFFDIYNNIGTELNNFDTVNYGETNYLTLFEQIVIGNSSNHGSSMNRMNSASVANMIANSHGYTFGSGETNQGSHNVGRNKSAGENAFSSATMQENNQLSLTSGLGENIGDTSNKGTAQSGNSATQKSVNTGDNLGTNTNTPQGKMDIPLKLFHEGYRGDDAKHPVNDGYITNANRGSSIANLAADNKALTKSNTFSQGESYGKRVDNSNTSNQSNGVTNHSNLASTGSEGSTEATTATSGNYENNNSNLSATQNQSITTGGSGSVNNSSGVGYNDSKTNNAQDHTNKSITRTKGISGATYIDLYNNYKQGLGRLDEEYLQEFKHLFLRIYSVE